MKTESWNHLRTHLTRSASLKGWRGFAANLATSSSATLTEVGGWDHGCAIGAVDDSDEAERTPLYLFRGHKTRKIDDCSTSGVCKFCIFTQLGHVQTRGS